VVEDKWRLVVEDPRTPCGVMDCAHGARSEQEYIKSEMVMKTIASASAKSRRKAIDEFE